MSYDLFLWDPDPEEPVDDELDRLFQTAAEELDADEAAEVDLLAKRLVQCGQKWGWEARTHAWGAELGSASAPAGLELRLEDGRPVASITVSYAALGPGLECILPIIELLVNEEGLSIWDPQRDSWIDVDEVGRLPQEPSPAKAEDDIRSIAIDLGGGLICACLGFAALPAFHQLFGQPGLALGIGLFVGILVGWRFVGNEMAHELFGVPMPRK